MTHDSAFPSKIALAGAVALFASIMNHAVLAQSQISRDTTTTINTGSPSFAGASLIYTNTIDLDTTAGTINTTLNIPTLATGISLSGLGGTTVTPGSVPDGTASVPVSIVSPGGTGQGWSFGYNLVAGPSAAQSFITAFVAGGFNELSFAGGGQNFLNTGGSFTSTVVLSGDWSAPGDVINLSYGAGYTIGHDFTFDGTNTTFSVSTNNYQGVNPTIAFTLVGSAVPAPEPTSFAVLGSGLVVIGAMRRRRRGRC